MSFVFRKLLPYFSTNLLHSHNTSTKEDGFVWGLTITGRSKWDFRAQIAIRNVIVAFKRRYLKAGSGTRPQQPWTASLDEKVFMSLFRGIRNARADFHTKAGTRAALTAGTGPQDTLAAAVDRFEAAGGDLRPDVTEELLQLAGGLAEDGDEDDVAAAAAAAASCRAEHEDTGLGEEASSLSDVSMARDTDEAKFAALPAVRVHTAMDR
ncbi:hypothetical protein P8C59_008942 [Phyllachora maydis]|uniref:Uncharacterized protein n=1 Tax=Phyllachora maydis TaxID=1825666 RepID=A0AAD9MHM4_9PEZI|nr:hypothetical protein P8C59_008942 [Phyllachora maydis]